MMINSTASDLTIKITDDSTRANLGINMITKARHEVYVNHEEEIFYLHWFCPYYRIILQVNTNEEEMEHQMYEGGCL